MKLYIPNTSEQSIGGGWTFLHNIKASRFFEVVGSWKECDLVLIMGATATNREEMIQAKAAGKKIVFRVDNIPKDSRNRGTAFSRMLDFAKMADFIIFQSEWARDYAGWWFKENGVDVDAKSCVIYNGIDPRYFYPEPSLQKKGRYVYIQYNRDENKRTPEAFYDFHQAFRKDKSVELWLIGRFSPESVEYGFDFFAGETVQYLGVVEDREQLGHLLRQCEFILFPAYADASPNTLMEAMACGCKPIGVNPVGGSIEVAGLPAGRTIQDMATDYSEVFNKVLHG